MSQTLCCKKCCKLLKGSSQIVADCHHKFFLLGFIVNLFPGIGIATCGHYMCGYPTRGGISLCLKLIYQLLSSLCSYYAQLCMLMLSLLSFHEPYKPLPPLNLCFLNFRSEPRQHSDQQDSPMSTTDQAALHPHFKGNAQRNTHACVRAYMVFVVVRIVFSCLVGEIFLFLCLNSPVV